MAIHLLHVLPTTSDPGLAEQLLHGAVVLYRLHRALELDGRAHDYTADEWMPAVYDDATSVLGAARLDREPPSLVEHAQDAVSWLSGSRAYSRCTSSPMSHATPQASPTSSSVSPGSEKSIRDPKSYFDLRRTQATRQNRRSLFMAVRYSVCGRSRLL